MSSLIYLLLFLVSVHPVTVPGRIRQRVRDRHPGEHAGAALEEVGRSDSDQVCDKIKHPSVVSMVGNVGMIAAFVFVGPLPFVPLEPSVALIQSMMAVFGIGFAPVKVSSFVRSQKAAIQNGFNDDAETYSLITGDLYFLF
jgi:hypothetical protein